MTELAITPNYEKKRLELAGTVAAGEHVAVTIVGGGAWIGTGKALRLRVICGARTVAKFPLWTEDNAEDWPEDVTSADAWDSANEGADATCVLNLNTVPVAKLLRFGGMCLWVLDDAENHTLYGSGEYIVEPWPKERGEDEPYYLDEYPDIVAELGERIDAVEKSISDAVDEANGIVAYVTAARNDAQSAAQIAGTARNGAQTAQGKAEDAQTAAEAAQVAAEAALPLDTTLATEGKAADAKAVGDAIALKADKSTTYTKSETYTKIETTNAISSAIATVVDSAPEAFDTLKEIADWIEDDQSGAAAMAAAIAGKADKVANAIEGNLATLDSNGNLADSGKAIGDFAVAKSLAPAFVAGDAYEVGDLCTSFDNDENHRGTWLYKCILATDGSQWTPPEMDPTHWALATVEDVLAALRRTVDGKADDNAVVKLTGDQSIGGTKTFTDPAYFNMGLAAPSTLAVYGQDSSARFEVDDSTTGDYVHFGVGDFGVGIGFEYTKNGNGSSYRVDLPERSGVLSVKADVDAAATAATNYTDAAIGAAIANTNPTFSNAVLSVGLNIDTNSVAVLNDIAATFGGFPIEGTATTVGGLLAALAAAVAALKRTKADASALRYAMPASVALVAENDAATLVCADRAVTNATIASGFSTLNLTFPAAVSGYVRDFYLRITVAAGQSAPALSLPQGVTIENAGGAVPEIADGEASAAATTLVWFSETAPGIFTTKSETVKAVA